MRNSRSILYCLLHSAAQQPNIDNRLKRL